MVEFCLKNHENLEVWSKFDQLDWKILVQEKLWLFSSIYRKWIKMF